MKIKLMCVGRLRDKHVQRLCEDYVERIQRYGGVEVQEVKAASCREATQAVETESERLLQQLKPTDRVWVLDERGAAFTSTGWASQFDRLELQSTPRLVLVLGGAYGLSPVLRERGELVALSKLTFPHELCRVIVLEQIYRARSIQRREPYHH